MTLQLQAVILLGCLFVGVLLGSTFTVQAIRPQFRQQARERRRLNAEWLAVREAQQSVQMVRCPRCGCYLPEGSWYPNEYPEEDTEPPDDD